MNEPIPFERKGRGRPAGAPSHCSHCGESGHTISKCPTLDAIRREFSSRFPSLEYFSTIVSQQIQDSNDIPFLAQLYSNLRDKAAECNAKLRSLL